MGKSSVTIKHRFEPTNENLSYHVRLITYEKICLLVVALCPDGHANANRAIVKIFIGAQALLRTLSQVFYRT
ncbi:MAG: hypothetical protein AAFX80_05580 [Cyanobacteria bacterium J06639_18]